MAEPALPPPRYEPSDVSFRFLACGAGVVIASILLCTLGVVWIYPDSVRDRRIPSELPVYPAPGLQSNPPAELRRFTAEELSRLNSAGWVDKNQGIAHIPIDEAMQRIAAQGIPDWPASLGSGP